MNLVLQVLFLRQTLKNDLLGCSRNVISANGEKWQSWCGLEIAVIPKGGEG